ncbi:MAG: hypothetical protein IJ899_11855 [Blautia sp.]|nr:hypothetical protein [Blautia sp.]
MSSGAEIIRYKDAEFLVECKEHILRIASPGTRNYIIKGILSYGEVLELPEKIDGDPVTSFAPGKGVCPVSFPGVKRLCLPRYLGKYPEQNDLFPDLVELSIDEANQIYKSDGRMLYRDSGKELYLSLAGGLSSEPAVVPAGTRRLGSKAFVKSTCPDIIFENPDIEAPWGCFEDSAWLDRHKGPVYVGNMLYFVPRDISSINLKQETSRIHPKAFDGKGDFLEVVLLPECSPAPAYHPDDTVLRSPLCSSGQNSVPSGRNTFQSGALCGADRVIVQEGTVPGLIDALLPPFYRHMKFGTPLSACGSKKTAGTVVRVLQADRRTRGTVLLPHSLSETGVERAVKIWNSPVFQKDAWNSLFPFIQARDERMDFAVFSFSGEQNVTDSALTAYLRENAGEATERAAAILDEGSFVCFAGSGIPGPEDLRRVLKVLQDYGSYLCTAKVLDLLGHAGKDAADLPDKLKRKCF